MATVNIILKDGSVRYKIKSVNTDTTISTGLKINESQFNKENERNPVNQSVRNSKAINELLYSTLLNYRSKIVSLNMKETAQTMTAKEIKDFITGSVERKEEQAKKEKEISYIEYAERHAEHYTGGTRKLVERTNKLVNEFFGNREVQFSDFTVGVLRTMDEEWAKTYSINYRSIIFRNMRTIFNRAMDDEVCTNYPFRKFKIKTAHKEKEYLPEIYFHKLTELEFSKTEKLLETARDAFLLSFYFCGANLTDIYSWTQDNVKNNHLVFVRTKIAHYEPDKISIAITPEAKKILEKYKGKEDSLLDFSERYADYETFRGNIDKRIKKIGEMIGFKFSFYYARYSWATYADKIGVDEKVISKSLGHTDTSVAGKYYIHYDWKRTDEANNKVIEYISGKNTKN